MKKNKIKKIFLIPISILIIFMVISVNHLSSLSYSKKIIKELNDNTSFPYKFTMEIDKFYFDKKKWERYEEFNDISYTHKKNGDVLSFCGYPDLSDTDVLTYYSVSNNTNSVFGFHNGDNIIFADQCLKKFGYKKVGNKESYDYEKGRVSIWLVTQKIEGEDEIIDIVDGITISLHSTDWFHKGNYK